jgi:hypothetical protein
VGSVITPGEAYAVAVAGSHALAADGLGFRVIDIMNPENPQITGSVDTPGFARDVGASGTYAYVADGYAGLQVIDITNPAEPWIAGSVNTPRDAISMAISAAGIYVADGYSGLQILPMQCTVIAVYLGSFDLIPEHGAVRIRWRVQAEGGPVEFRLVGDNGVRQWEVSFAESGVGTYLAEDRSVNPGEGGSITYRLFSRTAGQPWSLLAEGAVPQATPVEVTRLIDASPNPFNPLTTIRFECREPGNVRLTVYDLAGRRVAVLCDGWLGAGPHERDWNGRDAAGREVAAGPYLVQLRTRQGIDVQKIMLAK